MERLAIDGGVPVRKEKIYYGHQWINNDDINSVIEVLKGDYLTTGPYVAKMEWVLEEYTGAKHAVAVSNGTAALHCACIAAGIKEGDEVITTPLTFAASANCVLYCGATPVFADVDPETYTIDPRCIEEKITDNTKAVIAVDFTGQSVRSNEIRDICNRYGLIYIEDAAHSIGTKYEGKMVGSIADMTCFSFHPVKTITSGEGGAVLTNDDDLYEKLVRAHTHGITRDKSKSAGFPEDEPWYYDEISLGYNYRITDFQAALFVSQLSRIDVFKKRRKEIVQQYDEAFSEMPEIIVQNEIKESDTCRHLYIIRLNEQKLKCSRKDFFMAMAAENIQCQVHYIPVYWFSLYEKVGYKRGICPNAEEIYKGIVSIPLYPSMSDDDVKDVIAAVKKVVAYYRK